MDKINLKAKPKKNSLYIIFIILLILGCTASFFGGKSVGSASAAAGLGAEETKASGSQDKVTTKSIALVNMDSGVDVNGETQYYGKKLIEKAGNNFIITGLADAKRGLKTGAYAGYLIIPDNFSQCAVSLNNTPTPAELSYVVNGDLTEESKTSVVSDIASLQRSMNNDLSYIYLSSLLDTVHQGQDDVESVLANDSKDTDAIMRIEPYSLISMVQMPEMENPDTTFEPLDIQQYLTGNQALVDTINEKYVEYIALSQTDLDALKQEGSNVSLSFNATTDTVNGINLVEDETGAKVYQSGLTNLQTAMEAHNTALTGKETEITGKVQNLATDSSRILNHYTASVNRYNQMLNLQDPAATTGRSAAANAVVQLAGSKATSNDVTITADTAGTGLVVKGAAAEATVTPTVLASGAVDMDQLAADLQTAYDTVKATPGTTMTAGDVSQVLTQTIPDVKGEAVDEQGNTVMDTTGTQPVLIQDELTAMNTAAQNLATTGVTLPKMDVTTSLGDVETSIVNPLVDKTNGLKTDLLTQLGTSNDQLTTFNQAITTYDPFSKVDKNEIQDYVEKINANGSSISDAFSQNSTKQGEIMQRTTTAATENMTKMQESVSKATTESQKLVTDNLNGVKTIRQENSSANQSMLKGFSEVLPYSRIGTVENTGTYQYMTEPISFAQKASDTKGTQTTVSPSAAGAQQQSTAPAFDWRIIIYGLLALALIAVVVVGTLTFRKKERKLN
ncbi:MAG: hypothetical protein PHN26_06055 [Eubacteriaceae bacterium]|nr:hypothetical protein [Eubacteriaceae bacterium]